MKTKQVNIRLTEEERDQFKSLAMAHGLDASDYFRLKVLSVDVATFTPKIESTEELAQRATAANKIIKRLELEKRPQEHVLQRLAYLSSINQKLDAMAELLSPLQHVEPTASSASELTVYLEELQQFIQGKA